MRIVKFKDGTYGVRRFVGAGYFYIEYEFAENFWTFKKYRTRMSLEKAKKLLKDVIKYQKETKEHIAWREDNGKPI